ncbi:epidermal growth factor-like protein [Anopheles bellator]|uniref:epidermal growth factor-like protein n=1 Tax=Anopheles bellator TaxID=139047 RepID=UPI0026472238|nr:epidermal growth factor-like protein [Anopheles bellator]
MESLKWCLLVAVALLCQFGLAPCQEGVKTWRKGGVKGGHEPAANGTQMVDAAELGQNQTGSMVDLHRSNESVSALDRFLNKTKAQMPAGVCFEEVPIASLLSHYHRGNVPVGNASDPSLSRVHVCCAGYERNVYNFRKCEPICTEPCLNGLCVAPDTCECYPDFVRNSRGRCVPTCPIGCDHGECQPGTNVCQCHEGYELDRNDRKLCVPRCTGGCGEAGRCVDVERCECDEGFEFHPHQKCAPRCADGCGNGKCVAPGVCECDVGYAWRDTGCKPICSPMLFGCLHGTCVAPETCSCNPGYILSVVGQCMPVCDKPCLHGDCTGRNVCTCDWGYENDAANPFHCIPHCPNGCRNGVCSGPNMCLCNDGYVKDRSLKGSQACVRRYDSVKS